MKLGTGNLEDMVGESEGRALRLAVLEELFDEAPDVAFFVKDREGRYLAVNRSLVERYGFSRREEILGRRSADICRGPFGEVPTEQDLEVIRTGKPLRNHLEMHWRRPREACWCLTTKLPLRDAGGGITGLVGFSRDLREPVPVEAIPGRVALALEEFERDCGEPVGPSELAERAGLPAPRFARLVKRVFGVTPSQYITRTRIRAAMRLLEETEETVAAVAVACGFSDHSAFTRSFRAATGMTPTEFRVAGR